MNRIQSVEDGKKALSYWSKEVCTGPEARAVSSSSAVQRVATPCFCSSADAGVSWTMLSGHHEERRCQHWAVSSQWVQSKRGMVGSREERGSPTNPYSTHGM